MNKSVVPRLSPLTFLLVFAALLASCAQFGDFAARRADKEAYKIVANKQETALGESRPFTIGKVEDEATSRLLNGAGAIDWSKDIYTTPSYQLTLADTLAIAITNNRSYQSQKESLFSEALGLSNTRYDYGAIFTGSADASYTRSETGNNTPGGEVTEKFGSHGFNLGVSKILLTGATVSLQFTHDYVKYFTNQPRAGSNNRLAFNVVQPLLRNFGPLVSWENLRQDERNMIYAVRDFERYQQGFVIDVADRFYGLLSSRDQLRNADNNLERVQENWEKMKMLNEAGRRSQLEVDQARQEVLKAEERLSDARARYSSQLESFKDYLGVPLGLDFGPDPDELKAIEERGLVRPEMKLEEATQIALQNRLDLQTVENRLQDASRATTIALRNFLPELEGSYSYQTTKSPDDDQIKLDFQDNTQTFGLNLGLPFDWTPRRNRYRTALINEMRAQREVEQTRNEVIMEVRDNWRELDRLRTSYEIQKESVQLAERRVDNAAIRLQMGEFSTRDWLEAQQDLLDAQNALTEALVAHTIQRLRFWNSIERLKISPKGMWYDQKS